MLLQFIAFRIFWGGESKILSLGTVLTANSDTQWTHSWHAAHPASVGGRFSMLVADFRNFLIIYESINKLPVSHENIT